MLEELIAALHRSDYVTLPCRILAAFFALRLTLRFVEPKPGRWRWALLYMLHYFTTNMIVYAGMGDYFPPLCMLVLFIAGLLLFCRGRTLARLSMAVILVLLPISLNAVLTSLRPPFDVFIYLFIALFWGVVLLLVSRAMPEIRRPPISAWRLWLLVDLLALMPFGAAFSAIALTQPIPQNENPNPFLDTLVIQNERVLLIILGLSVIASLVILASVVLLSRHERLQNELLLWEVRSRYYQGLEESQQQVRRLRHDMANHLTALAGLSGESQRRYLEQLSCSPAMSAGQRYCENLVANAVLSAKLPLIEDGGIESRLDVRLPEKIPILDIDLCALLANGLDNALEASLKLPLPERKISLSAAVEKGFFVLRIANAANGAVKIRGGQTPTSKAEPEQHGFGLAGIKEIAERYGGTAEPESAEREFRLLVMLPVAS